MIENKRVRNVDMHLTGIHHGSTFYIAKKVSEVEQDKLKTIGLPTNLRTGIKILGRSIGSVSRYNVNGKEIPIKTLPKETRYREICIKDWHGNYHYVDIPYQRYHRQIIDAPETEFFIKEINNDLFVISEQLTHTSEKEEYNRHVINLFLEYFGNCDILNSQQQIAFQDIPIRRVNWEILPAGDYPWSRIPSDGIKLHGPMQRLRQRYTFESINKYHPESIAIGTGGFRGYVVFGFPSKNIFLLEHLLNGNATYVFENNWEQFSQLSKGEILNSHLQRERIIHRDGWEREINKLLSN